MSNHSELSCQSEDKGYSCEVAGRLEGAQDGFTPCCHAQCYRCNTWTHSSKLKKWKHYVDPAKTLVQVIKVCNRCRVELHHEREIKKN